MLVTVFILHLSLKHTVQCTSPYLLAVPGSSLSVAVITNGSESIVLSWQSPNASKYGVIIKYTAECNGVLYSTNLTTLEIGSLHPFTQYNCCVVAFNLGGNGSKNCDSATTNQAGMSVRCHDVMAFYTSIVILISTIT